MSEAPHPNHHPLKETFVYFFHLGILGFGGPLALIAQMQKEAVEHRRWMKSEDFAKAFALIKAMPGPVAFQTAVFLGRKRAGLWGGLLAAVALLLPSFVLMVLFGLFYEDLRALRGGPTFLAGMQAAALGVIFASLRGLSVSHSKKPIFWFSAIAVIALTYRWPALEPLYIIGTGAFTAVLVHSRDFGRFLSQRKNTKIATLPLLTLGSSIAPLTLGAGVGWELFWSCFKSGAFVFGSGLAIVPLMEHDFVTRLGWLSRQEFMDALAFGQITPGPVVITATFIGFKALGIVGALVSTLGIFLAPFVHMMTWFPAFVDRLSRQIWIPAFLTGAVAAVVGSIFATGIHLAMSLEFKTVTLPLLTIAFLAALKSRWPVWIIIPASGALAGWLG